MDRVKVDRKEREVETNQDRNDGDWQMGKMDWIDRGQDEELMLLQRRPIMEADYRKKSTRFLSFQEQLLKNMAVICLARFQILVKTDIN